MHLSMPCLQTFAPLAPYLPISRTLFCAGNRACVAVPERGIQGGSVMLSGPRQLICVATEDYVSFRGCTVRANSPAAPICRYG